MDDQDKTSVFSDKDIIFAARDIIKIERDCFYGDQLERERLGKIRSKLDAIFAASYSNGEKKDDF
jgi:hypothetical protein